MYCPRICLEVLRKPTGNLEVRIAVVSAEIQTEHLMNTNMKLYL
jgi:hypothetical protein